MPTTQRMLPHPACRLSFLLLTCALLMLAYLPLGMAQPAKAKDVIIAPVKLQQISDRVEALGTAQALESVNITSNVTEKITEIHFDDGQQVSAGDLLVVLDQAEEQANLKQAEAIYNERKLSLKRLSTLEQRQLASADDIDRTRFELQQAEASIKAIKTRISNRIIQAPFDGMLGLRNISVGALVETGDLITTLDDTRQIKLNFTVPSVFLSELSPGLKIQARAQALGNRIFMGEVKSINSRVDPVTRSVQVRALLENPDRKIIPGILMQVDLLRNTRQAMLIPESALLPLADKQFVMLRVNKDGLETVEKRQITTGLRLPGYVEVLQGLKADQQVVTHGNHLIKPGDALNVLALDDGSQNIAQILKQSKTPANKNPDSKRQDKQP